MIMFEVSQAARWLIYAKKEIPNSFTVSIIYALVEAQIHMHSDMDGEWCEVWKVVAESLDAFPENRDMREDAINVILDYIGLYKDCCE